jgi:Na+-translocating ferredoxin:NAD+ oxidoreductase subunit B
MIHRSSPHPGPLSEGERIYKGPMWARPPMDRTELMTDKQRPPRKRIPNELAAIDADRCTGCRACIEVCPVDCIQKIASHPQTLAFQAFCEIDWDRCIGCRLCVVLPSGDNERYELLVCPWDAIAMVAPDDLVAAAAELGGPSSYAEANRDRLVAAAARQAGGGNRSR